MADRYLIENCGAAVGVQVFLHMRQRCLGGCGVVGSRATGGEARSPRLVGACDSQVRVFFWFIFGGGRGGAALLRFRPFRSLLALCLAVRRRKWFGCECGAKQGGFGSGDEKKLKGWGTGLTALPTQPGPFSR
jgi:hypothetical protein